MSGVGHVGWVTVGVERENVCGYDHILSYTCIKFSNSRKL